MYKEEECMVLPMEMFFFFLPLKKKIEERKFTQVLAGPAEFCSSTARLLGTWFGIYLYM